ncbi:Peroxisome biogenesis protein 1 [Bienertia sinuspersici]
MELEVRVVAGVENCHVSLPISLLQTLQSTHPHQELPHFLILQLRSLSHDLLWHVSWCGSSSSSSAIECPSNTFAAFTLFPFVYLLICFGITWIPIVGILFPLPFFLIISIPAFNPKAIHPVHLQELDAAEYEIAQEFAACIGLPDGEIVQVRVLSNVPKAGIITIEPVTEDDWEVVELNAQSAEAAILNQVRTIQGKMSFPLWLHGHRIVTFTVVSMMPDRTVVQLVPGTEVAVAPKRRKKSADLCKDSSSESVNSSHFLQKALLRVQDPKKMLIHQSHLGGGHVGIELTCIALVHPETAKCFLFESLHVVVIVPRRPSTIKVENSGNKTLKKQLSSSSKELGGKLLTDENDSRYAIVRVVFSECVAKGHLMLSQSLCRYLRVSFHSWIYMQDYVSDLKKDAPSFSLSPCQFRMNQNSHDHQNSDAEVLDDSFNLEDYLSLQHSAREMARRDRSSQELVSTLFDDSSDTTNKEIGSSSNAKERLMNLLYSWLMAQFHAITAMTGVKVTSLVLGPTTLICFELTSKGCLSDNKWQSSTDSLSYTNRMVESANEILYVLRVSGESSPGQKYCAFDIAMEDLVTTAHDVSSAFSENLSMGSYVSYDTCKDHVFNQITTPTISSLSWMGIAASDVINSRNSYLLFAMSLLSPLSFLKL